MRDLGCDNSLEIPPPFVQPSGVMRILPALVVAATLAAPSGCFEANVSNAELRAAVVEIVEQGQALALESEVLEITTSFTIGGGLAEIAEEIRNFAESQLPCSTVTHDSDNHSLTIDLGSLDDACTYNGHTFAGVITVAVSAVDGATVVDHTFTGLTNGQITLDGTKQVTWTTDTRRVVTDYEIDRDGTVVTTTSDRTMILLVPAEGLRSGIQIDGERAWNTATGAWDLDIAGVEVRWTDPVPQAGTYTLTTPKDQTIAMTFARLDDTKIAITVTAGARKRVFHVSSTGAVEDGA